MMVTMMICTLEGANGNKGEKPEGDAGRDGGGSTTVRVAAILLRGLVFLLADNQGSSIFS